MGQSQERAFSSPADTDRDGKASVLVRILRGEEAETAYLSRDVAARELGDTGGEAEVSALIEALATDDSWLVRQEAAWALGCIKVGGDLVLPALLKAVASDKDESVRCAAAESTGRIKVDAGLVVPSLIRALEVDDSTSVVSVVMGVLGKIGNSDAATALKPYVMSDERANLPWWSVRGLRTWAVKALAMIDPVSALPEMSEVLKRPDECLEVREEALRAVLGAGRPAVPVLIHVLATDQLPSFRKEAATGLGRIGLDARAAVPALTGAMADADEHVRREASASLARIVNLAKQTGSAVPQTDVDPGVSADHVRPHGADRDAAVFKFKPTDSLVRLTRWLILADVLLEWPAAKRPSQAAITAEIRSRGVNVKRPTVISDLNEIGVRLGGRPLLVARQQSGRASEFAEGAKAALAAARDVLNAYVGGAAKQI